MSNQIILSYPFSGSLYAFFADELGAHHTDSNHPYYLTLYGKNYRELLDLSLTLAVLYKEIIIKPVDNPLPDMASWETERGYENKELGIYSPFEDWYSAQGEITDQVNKDMSDSVINTILRRVPKQNWQQILRDTRYEIRLAKMYGCPVICSGGRRALIQRMAELDESNREVGTVSESSLKAIEDYIDISGLIFNPRTLDSVYELKADKDLRSYADDFVSLVHGFKDESNVKQRLLELIHESINKSGISAKAAGFFDATSTVLEVIGLIPILGNVTSLAGIVSSGASYGAKKYQRKQEWYQLTPQIHKTLSTNQIISRVAEELNSVRENR
ncbi:hypothetical protein [Candidatus Leptofilum sp.]|uniref:hypothetical protein n=1 Tax=Candidatus Leptofilum sp. TaxID=3241576 RepID=UPI003B58BB4D